MMIQVTINRQIVAMMKTTVMMKIMIKTERDRVKIMVKMKIKILVQLTMRRS